MAIVFQNRACDPDTNSPCTYNRTFVPQTDEISVLAANNVTLAVFFDIAENVKQKKRKKNEN